MNISNLSTNSTNTDLCQSNLEKSIEILFQKSDQHKGDKVEPFKMAFSKGTKLSDIELSVKKQLKIDEKQQLFLYSYGQLLNAENVQQILTKNCVTDEVITIVYSYKKLAGKTRRSRLITVPLTLASLFTTGIVAYIGFQYAQNKANFSMQVLQNSASKDLKALASASKNQFTNLKSKMKDLVKF